MNTFSNIVEAEDLLDRARALIECAENAATNILKEDAEPISTTLEIAGEKITQAVQLLKEYHEPQSTQAFDARQAGERQA